MLASLEEEKQQVIQMKKQIADKDRDLEAERSRMVSDR